MRYKSGMKRTPVKRPPVFDARLFKRLSHTEKLQYLRDFITALKASENAGPELPRKKNGNGNHSR